MDWDERLRRRSIFEDRQPVRLSARGHHNDDNGTTLFQRRSFHPRAEAEVERRRRQALLCPPAYAEEVTCATSSVATDRAEPGNRSALRIRRRNVSRYIVKLV